MQYHALDVTGSAAARPALAPRLRAFAVGALAILAAAAANAGGAAETLLARYESIAPQLRDSSFRRPLVLESREDDGTLTSDVYAVVAHPFETLQANLQSAHQWCDVLILHLDVKRCRAESGSKGRTIALSVGKKFEQVLGDSHCMTFRFRDEAASAQHRRVTLVADRGPLGTRDYRLAFEAVALPDGRSFVHLRYSYGYGAVARLAMQAYFGVFASEKIGFSVVGRTPQGGPLHVGGLRGEAERQTMRHFLAVSSYLDTLAAPAHDRLESRLRDWFAATERHALQLREVDEATYLSVKRREVKRQQAEVPGGGGAV